MNIVFFGTSDFALAVLHRLIDSEHKILAVVTQPDRQKGRALKISPAPTKVSTHDSGFHAQDDQLTIKLLPFEAEIGGEWCKAQIQKRPTCVGLFT